MEAQVDSPNGPGLEAPVTPPVIAPQLPPTPRQQHTTRAHGDDVEDSHEAKRAKLESLKKQKINQLRESHEAMIKKVKVGSDEYATLDDYENEITMDDRPGTEFGMMRISSPSAMFQMRCGLQEVWKSHHQRLKAGLTNLWMKLKSIVC